MHYQLKHQIYTEYLRQKAKVEWIKHGDENTAVFHQSIRARRVQNQVYAITDAYGVWQDHAEGVEEAFIDYYQKLLGTNHAHRKHVLQQIVQNDPLITEDHRRILNAPYTTEDVKQALFSILGNKAPGLDGFGAHFYRDNWELIGNELTTTILDFLTHKKLLKELNSTVITLIPKSKCPTTITDFRPISCCNVLYKCITKLLCNRLREVIPDIIAKN